MAALEKSEAAICVSSNRPETMIATTVGTCHFVSVHDAYRYYNTLGCDRDEVDRKRREGELAISLPPPVDGAVIRPDKDGRYHYVHQ